MMRTNPRFRRVRLLIKRDVPHDQFGRLLMCHHCQRAVYFAGSLDRLLIRDLEREAMKHVIRSRGIQIPS